MGPARWRPRSFPAEQFRWRAVSGRGSVRGFRAPGVPVHASTVPSAPSPDVRVDFARLSGSPVPGRPADEASVHPRAATHTSGSQAPLQCPSRRRCLLQPTCIPSPGDGSSRKPFPLTSRYIRERSSAHVPGPQCSVSSTRNDCPSTCGGASSLKLVPGDCALALVEKGECHDTNS
jgi:hypothetical protein